MLRAERWNEITSKVEEFFRARDYIKVHVPLLVTTPGMEPYLDPFAVTVKTHNPTRSFTAGLITSPEFSMKKLLGAGMEKIFTITPVFRNDEALGPHNWPQFTLLEWYAPGSYEDLMKETEALYQFVLENTDTWPRYAYQEAKVDEFGDPHVEAKRFFVTHFPVEQAALSKISADGTYAERFESYGDGLELSNGFAELTNPDEQRARFMKDAESRRAQGKDRKSVV